MKKIFLGLLVISSIAFGCIDPKEHDRALEAFNNPGITITDSAIYVNPRYIYANARLDNDEDDYEATQDTVKIMNILEKYCKQHGMKFEIEE